MSAFTEAAVVLCQTMHPDVRPLTTVPGATDPRLLIAACFACQRAAEALDSAGLLTCPTSPAVPKPVPHDHTEYVEGCFRCDLSREETRPTTPDRTR